jgi:hypothetical protein
MKESLHQLNVYMMTCTLRRGALRIFIHSCCQYWSVQSIPRSLNFTYVRYFSFGFYVLSYVTCVLRRIWTSYGSYGLLEISLYKYYLADAVEMSTKMISIYTYTYAIYLYKWHE